MIIVGINTYVSYHTTNIPRNTQKWPYCTTAGCIPIMPNPIQTTLYSPDKMHSMERAPPNQCKAACPHNNVVKGLTTMFWPCVLDAIMCTIFLSVLRVSPSQYIGLYSDSIVQKLERTQSRRSILRYHNELDFDLPDSRPTHALLILCFELPV